MLKYASSPHKVKKTNKRFLYLFILLLSLTTLTFAILYSQSKNDSYHPTPLIENTVPDKKIPDKENPDKKTEPSPSDELLEAVKHDSWSLVLVNKWNPIKANNSIELLDLSNGISIDKRIYPYLQKMFDAARNDGVYPVVVSGYRSQQYQETLFNTEIANNQAKGLSYEDAKKEAEYWVAVPGTSEHQLGLAVDINSDNVNSTNNDVYRWLEKNAHRYGFIYRYPEGKMDLTGIANEPWHYRFVGEKIAAEMYKKNICLEEYLNIVN